MTETVNHPNHYRSESGFEAIDVIAAFGLCFWSGNALKYMCRAGLKTKDSMTDLSKALWYIDDMLSRGVTNKEYNNDDDEARLREIADTICTAWGMDLSLKAATKSLLVGDYEMARFSLVLMTTPIPTRDTPAQLMNEAQRLLGKN